MSIQKTEHNKFVHYTYIFLMNIYNGRRRRKVLCLVGWTDEQTENISTDCIYEWRQTENRNTYIKQNLWEQFIFVNQTLKYYVNTRRKIWLIYINNTHFFLLVSVMGEYRESRVEGWKEKAPILEISTHILTADCFPWIHKNDRLLPLQVNGKFSCGCRVRCFLALVHTTV